MRIYVLGAGSPTPTPTRYGSSFAVEVGGDLLMVDCGPAATDKLVKVGLWPTDVDYLFFTHHHFDHDVDYPCFLLTRWDQSNGKENRLQVYGPDLTEQLTHRILDADEGAFSHDWKARIGFHVSQKVHVQRGGTLPRTPPDVFAKDVGPGKVYSADNWEMTAAPAEHVQPYLDSLAYRLDSPEGSVVFTGDTQPCQSVIDLAKDADAMLCMCWDDEESVNFLSDGEEEYSEGFGHCGTRGAAQMALEAGVKKLVLVHMGKYITNHGPMEKGIGDVRSIYDGEVIFSEELMSFEV